MKELIEKALKEVKDAIENVEGRYFHDGSDDWQIDDLTLLAGLETAQRALEESRKAV